MSSKLIRPKRALPLLALLVACLSLPAMASAASYSIKWNKSALLENPNKGGALDSVACAPTVKTPTTKIPAKTLLCLAGDLKGDIWATAHPSRPAVGWRRESIDTGSDNAITGISCPSTTFCVAVDAGGRVMHSTDPLAGVKGWSKPARIDTATQTGGGYAGFSAISCPTTKLCIAVDNAANGQVAYTTDPAGSSSAWTLATVGTGVSLSSVACASTTLCVIGGSERFYSINPTGGASAWKAAGTLSSNVAVMAALTCNTVKLCIGVGYGNAGSGLASASSTPSTGASAWTGSQIGSDPPAIGAQLVDGVACPKRNFCVAVDGASNAYTSATPVRGGWSAAKPLKKASQATLSQISCNSTVCVDVDNRGTVTYGSVKVASTTTKTTTTTTTPTTTGTTTTSTTKTG
ncbi:MAG TPA: hypothetical protein VHV75_18065 [Solirubrobacteraceae bacterium]|jgi:hypothetical protein|nr:hypothetical protein [Solirubrobacteraceae bacterium]